ncbi:MAG: HAD-IA family hydrolase [Clostridia bacterium]|nr:HAD-IA family hydrolase [Clostridia bacterium]
MIKNILFDLDGTITDPRVGITTCIAYAAKKAGLGEYDPDKFVSFIGPPLKQQFMEYFNVDSKMGDLLVQLYRERFSTIGLFENEPYANIDDLLCSLKDKSLYIATSKPEIFSKKILEKFELIKYFKKVYGSDLDGKFTEKEELISRLISCEKLNPDECVMVGDRKFDIIGAKNNGITSVGVLYGYGDYNELLQSGADYIVSSVDELKELLCNKII